MKINNCPFCGKEAGAESAYRPNKKFDRNYWVECVLCEFATPDYFTSEEKAVNAWNSIRLEGMGE